jgi:WD40 repeat protein
VLLAAVQQEGLFSFGPAGNEPAQLLFDEGFWRFDFAPNGAIVLETPAGIRWLDLDVRVPIAYPLGAKEGFLRSNFSADFTRLVTSHEAPTGGYHAGWQTIHGKWERVWASPAGPIDAAALSMCPTGSRFCYFARVGEPDRPRTYAVMTRSVTTGADEATGVYPYSRYTFDRLRFRPDGRQLLAVHESALVVWPVPQLGTPRVVRNDSRKHFTAAAYHPNGRQLFTTSNDSTVIVWDTETWEPVRRFVWEIGKLTAVAVSADGTLAAAGGEKGRIMVWDVD